MGPAEARATFQGRVAKWGEQQTMGRQGAPISSLRPVAWDGRLDAFDQLLQACLLTQAVHQVGRAALALAVSDAMDSPAEGRQWGRAAISRVGHRGNWQRG